MMELSQVAKDWSWLIALDGMGLVTVSPFGDLLLRDSSGAFCLLDVNFGELQYATSEGTDPAILFPYAFDMRIASKYIEAGLLPADGQCFGYRNPLVTRGSLGVENVYIATLSEYISFMGDFHRQIQDVPDGATVTIKVINQKVIQ